MSFWQPLLYRHPQATSSNSQLLQTTINTNKMQLNNLFLLSLAAGVTLAHPEKITEDKARSEAHLVGRSTNKCAAAIEKRKADILAKRSSRLQARHLENREFSGADDLTPRAVQYATIQNDTCVLAPDTIWGPYG